MKSCSETTAKATACRIVSKRGARYDATAKTCTECVKTNCFDC